MDPSNRRILASLDQLHLVRRIAHQKRTAQLPLYRGQLPVLEYILRNPGCTQAEVSERFLISPAAVAQSTKRMERAGLLQKRVDAENQRRKQLYVTDAGVAISEECRALCDQMDAAVMAGFAPEERELLSSYLGRLLSNAAVIAEVDLEHMDQFSFFALIHKAESDDIRKEKVNV